MRLFHIRSLFKGASKEDFCDRRLCGFITVSVSTFDQQPKILQSTNEGTPAAKRFPSGNQGFCGAAHLCALGALKRRFSGDRAIILDAKQVFVLGASIKDAGKRAFNIVPVEAPPMVEGMIKSYSRSGRVQRRYSSRIRQPS